MLANDVKKGMKLVLKGSGWNAVMFDNAKGLIRTCEVDGMYKEIGSVYAYDIAEVLNPATGQWEKVTLSPAQEKQKAKIKSFGF